MKKLYRSLYFLLAVGLATIISVSACSLALPKSVFISNIEPTDDSDEILVTISDANYNKYQLLYNIPLMKLQSNTDKLSIEELELISSEQNYTSELFGNDTDVLWKLTNIHDNSELNFKLPVNETIKIDITLEFMFFVSSSLKIAYLILPYDVDTSERIQDSVLYATILIVPLEDPENIKFSFVAHSYLTYFLSTSFIIYDSVQLFFLHGNGADCVNSVYFNYDQDSFQFLSQTSAWQDDLIDPRIEKLIISSYDWQTQVSEIKLIDLNNFKETLFEVSDEEILSLLGIETSKSTSSLSTIFSSTLTDSVVSVLPIFAIYLPVGFGVSILLVKLKVRSKKL